MSGSVVLTEEQREWYRDRYGISYVAIAENHVRPPRRVRRGHVKTKADADLLDAQRQITDMLRERFSDAV